MTPRRGGFGSVRAARPLRRPHRPPRLGGPTAPHGFTLFELILAIALSATLLTLIGTAINLYLMRVDASRTRVEEAQLARSVLALIADDLRGATIYEPQDTSAIARLMASSTSSADDAAADGRTAPSSGAGGTSTPGTAISISSTSGSSGSSGTSSSSSSSTSGSSEISDGTMRLGLNGSLAELYVDVTRLPRRDELFGTITGYTNAPMPVETSGPATGGIAAAAGAVPPSDLKTVRYFIRQGEQIDAASGAAHILAPDVQQRAAGLVRQVIPRPVFNFAQQSGDPALLESGQMLLAPEVVYLEFRYYNGQQVVDTWDMQEERSLPVAIEVRIWLASPESSGAAAGARYDLASTIGNARQYRQTVYLPMAELSGAGAGAMTGESSTSSSFDSESTSSGSSSSSSSSSGSSSSFGQP